MSKSKKNTSDPEVMINEYGADAIRWFILSDSPPEKDIQWTDAGVASASKFLQKIWNLNHLIISRKETKNNKKEGDKFIMGINNYVNKINLSIDNFRFNVSIAYFYEIYKYLKDSLDLNISNSLLKEGLEKVMKILVPFAPHLAYECLEQLKCKTTNVWPTIDKNNILDEIRIAVQINGKTRDIIEMKKDQSESEITKFVMKSSKAKKYVEGNKILKTIFVKNRIINFITK